MSVFKTEQESFWEGAFGDEYSKRVKGENIVARNINLFSKVISRTENVQSVLEFGSNIGMNLRAIKQLLPCSDLTAVEINKTAVAELEKWGEAQVHQQSILEFKPEKTWDMVLIKGVLIHINPEALQQVYELLYSSSSNYICISEYYNPTPVEVSYRGHSERLFKRDFAGEMLDKYPDLQLLDYGFAYHRDNNFPSDDLTWFLLKKR
jgi:spore coat polysaccharide biosynthesis protein SpsF